MQFLRETHQTNERVKVSRDFQLYFGKFQQAQRRDDGYQDTIIRRAEKNLDLSRTQRLPVHLALESTAVSGPMFNFSTNATEFPTINISGNAFTDI